MKEKKYRTLVTNLDLCLMNLSKNININMNVKFPKNETVISPSRLSMELHCKSVKR